MSSSDLTAIPDFAQGIRKERCETDQQHGVGSRFHQGLSRECAESLSIQNQTGLHAGKPGSTMRTEETWDYVTTLTDHNEYADGSHSEKRTSSDGTWRNFDHSVGAHGSYIDTVLDSVTGKTIVLHNQKTSGDYTEITTNPNGAKDILVHKQGAGASYSEVTTRSDGTVETVQHVEKNDGTFDEEIVGGDGGITHRHHTNGNGGAFTDTIERPDGSRFVHSERATGGYAEKDFDADGKLRTPPISVLATADHEFTKRVKDAIANLPAGERKLLAEGGWKYEIADKVVEADPELSDKKPRGYGANEDFYEVGGLNDVLTRRIIIGETLTNGAPPRPEGLVDHETGHAIDTLLGSRSHPFSTSEEFDRAYFRDVAALSSDEKQIAPIPYLTQYDDDLHTSQIAGKSEACADVYGAIHGSSSNKLQTERVLRDFPRVADLLRRKLNAVNNADSVDFGSSWPF